MKTPEFRPHFNRTLGKYYHTKKDYYGDMKSGGYVPYDGTVKQVEKKPYKASPWAREVINSIKSHTKNGKFRPSERLMKEIVGKQRKTDMASLPAHYQTGGMY